MSAKWENELRIKEISKYALQGILANPRFYDNLIESQKTPGQGSFPENAAKFAMNYAIALFNEQQKFSL